jgi:hypothetical protein
MKRLLVVPLMLFALGGCCATSLDPTTVNQQANAGAELMKRCQASVAKASSQCGGAAAADCKANVQEAQADCTGAKGIFDTLAALTTPK